MSPTPTPPATRTSRRTSRAWSIRSPTATRTSAASPRAQVSLNALQGNVISTSTPTDLAVQGAGFFVVSDSSGTLYLTRNGSFTPDASGNLVNSAGYYLMAANVQNGVSPLAANSLTGLQKVNVVNAGQTATATTTASLTANLPSTATPVAPANLPSDQFGGLDLYRRDIACRVRQSRRLAHDQSLFHQHRVQHLGGRRIRCVDSLRQRRLSLFVRSAGDADPYLQSDDRRAVLRLAALDSRSRTARR